MSDEDKVEVVAAVLLGVRIRAWGDAGRIVMESDWRDQAHSAKLAAEKALGLVRKA